MSQSLYKELLSLLPAPFSQPDWKVLSLFFSSLFKSMHDTAQDPSWHPEGNVFVHTQLVCEALVFSSSYAQASEESRFILFYAALLHDCAKPSCSKTDESGRIISPGHSRRGAIDARLILWKAEVPFFIRERICSIILRHQEPFFIFSSKHTSPDFMIRRMSCDLLISELFSVAQADLLGRGGLLVEDACLSNELMKERASELSCLSAPFSFRDDAHRVAYFRANGLRDIEVYSPPPSGSQVHLLSGPPASGKSFYARQTNLPVVSFDEAHFELGLRHGRKSGTAAHLVFERARRLLRAKAPFCWDSTNLSQKMRQKILDFLFSYDAQVRILYFEAPESILFLRNDKRDSTLSNRRLSEMLLKWEPPSPSEAHEVSYIIHGSVRKR